MVIKAAKTIKSGAEIVGISDVLGAGKSAVSGIVTPLPPGELEIARLEKWIVLADKGISLIGRAEGIIRPILERQGMSSQAPAPVQYVRLAPGEGGNINAEKGEGSMQNAERSAPVTTPAPAPAPAPAPVQAAGIDPMQIAGALRMIDNQAPGITASQIADLIEKNPDAVGRLMGAALSGGMLK